MVKNLLIQTQMLMMIKVGVFKLLNKKNSKYILLIYKKLKDKLYRELKFYFKKRKQNKILNDLDLPKQKQKTNQESLIF